MARVFHAVSNTLSKIAVGMLTKKPVELMRWLIRS